MDRAHPRHLLRSRAAISVARDAAATVDSSSSSLTSVAGGVLKRTTARIVSSFLDRRCINTEGANTCEKPAASTTTVIGALVGVGVALFLAVMGVLLFLHIRRTKADKAELENDPHELSDYGIDEIPVVKKGDKGGSRTNNLSLPTTQQKRLSAQELLEAQNPFGYGAEIADSDRVSVSTDRKTSPPRKPDAPVKM